MLIERMKMKVMIHMKVMRSRVRLPMLPTQTMMLHSTVHQWPNSPPNHLMLQATRVPSQLSHLMPQTTRVPSQLSYTQQLQQQLQQHLQQRMDQ